MLITILGEAAQRERERDEREERERERERRERERERERVCARARVWHACVYACVYGDGEGAGGCSFVFFASHDAKIMTFLSEFLLFSELQR